MFQKVTGNNSSNNIINSEPQAGFLGFLKVTADLLKVDEGLGFSRFLKVAISATFDL